MKQNVETVLAALFAKGYTPKQVMKSVAVKLSYVEKTGTPAEKKLYRAADGHAKASVTKMYVDAGPGVIPCDARCMNAVVHECECLCGGVNHAVNHIGHLLHQAA